MRLQMKSPNEERDNLGYSISRIINAVCAKINGTIPHDCAPMGIVEATNKIMRSVDTYAEEKIEECAFICEEFGHDPYPVQKRIAKAIRQLKAKQK